MLDLLKEALFSLAVSLVIGHLIFVFLEAPIQNILFHLTGMDKRKSKLKQDCSTAKLNADLPDRTEQLSKLFDQKSNGPIDRFDENANKLEIRKGNHVRYLAKACPESSGS